MSRSALAVAAGVVLAVLVAATPGPGRRLAEIPGDGPDPRYDVPLPKQAIRETGRGLTKDDTYALQTPGATPLVAGNLKAAGQLFFAPALPVLDVRRADWVIVYRDGTFYALEQRP
jgi:hypothetical protein